ncbi:MAG TPA: hypothetical protein VMV69_21840 [Pirellulales bacterium]|nr:hypothetical protein [Pirellulales bacterium]
MATPQHRMPGIRQTNRREDARGRETNMGDGVYSAAALAEPVEACVREHAVSSSLVMFGVGVALGSALVFVLRGGPRAAAPRGRMAATWNNVRDAVSDHLPDSVARFVAKAHGS